MVNVPATFSVANELFNVSVPIAKLSPLAIVTVYVPDTAIVATAVAALGAPFGFQLPAVPQSPMMPDCQKSPVTIGGDPMVTNVPPFPSVATSKSAAV